ncbi:MAG TPA: exodeoxyribonuclease VII small subunit [Opitutae bacterium]|nr:exodeoxyribonuclease VII small subunit [Opitutae bacterium]
MAKESKSLSFEEALESLEGIIESMESGEIALADLVAKFEEGSKLLKTCQSQLKEAEIKIEKLNIKTGELEDFEDALGV